MKSDGDLAGVLLRVKKKIIISLFLKQFLSSNVF